jgi:hypothetical protein
MTKDRDLVREVLGGDKQATRELVAWLTPVVRSRVRRVLARARGEIDPQDANTS